MFVKTTRVRKPEQPVTSTSNQYLIGEQPSKSKGELTASGLVK